MSEDTRNVKLASSDAPASATAGRTPPADLPGKPGKGSHLDRLEREESALWRMVVLFLVLLATGLALNSWENIQNLPAQAYERLSAIPASVLLLVLIFAAYVWKKKHEINELRSFVRGMRARDERPPTEEQLEKLLSVISQSQQRFREMVDSFDDVVIAVGLHGEVQAANRRFAEVVGKEFPEIVGHTLQEFFAEPDMERAAQGLQSFFERRAWRGVVRTRLAHNSEIRYFDCTLRAVVKKGEVTGISVIAQDVTLERESEARFTQLFETLQEGVYFSTPEGKLLDANPALVRMLGYASKEALLDVNVSELYFHPQDRVPLLEELNRNATIREREITLRKKDGNAIQCLDTSTAIRDSSGKVVRYQGTLVDITQRTEMEKRLHQEKEFARRLVDSLPDLVVVLDKKGRYTYVSPRIKEVLGFTPEELLNQNLGERTHEDDRMAMRQLHEELIAGKASYATLEYRTLHKDGTWRCLRATSCPLFDADGKITGVIASARDMTEMKQLEQQVIQSEKLAAMGQMIAGVAHELNNPLTAILGINDLLRERAADEDSRRQLELVQRQARRAAEIVQNLLTFARPPAPHRARLKLPELVLHTLQLHEYSLRLNNIHVDFDPARDAPADLPAIVGDQNQLMQVMLNLVVNAEQAIREVRERGTIRVRLGHNRAHGEIPTESSIWVSIQDDGPGIPPETLPKIFDPFFTTKRPGRGTGLGLSICMAILREHGGTIEAANAPEGGALLTVCLPVRNPAPASDMAMNPLPNKGSQTPRAAN
jgi:two-component system NtrC family sensor kinase